MSKILPRPDFYFNNSIIQAYKPFLHVVLNSANIYYSGPAISWCLSYLSQDQELYMIATQRFGPGYCPVGNEAFQGQVLHHLLMPQPQVRSWQVLPAREVCSSGCFSKIAGLGEYEVLWFSGISIQMFSF